MSCKLAIALCVTLLAPALLAQDPPILESPELFHPVWAEHGMVVSQKDLATRVGVEVLERGGNAVDAAVATAFALAVTLPRAGNLGGGGFLLLFLAESGETLALDFRETAPGRATREMFLDDGGGVDADRAQYSHLAVGVPGSVAGLTEALARWGSWPLADVVAPAIRLAEEGFPLSYSQAQLFEFRRARFSKWPASKAIFVHGDGAPWRPGDRLVQADLARTLRSIAKDGADGFYRGEVARRIVAEMEAHGGLVSAEDLAGYRPVVRAPVRGSYRDVEVAAMPPPSSGGVQLVELLNLVEGWPLRELGAGAAATIHRLAEAMKLSFPDRARYLGDPAFVEVPVERLTSKEHAATLRAAIDLGRARPSDEISAGDAPREGSETTHLSVVDRRGNAVALTTTLNFSFGSHIVVPGTGVLLNNEMDDFAAAPGVPNAYGVTGDEANSIAPGKRPLSSMVPTILLRRGKPFLVTGTPGGSRIPTTVLQVILGVVDFDLNLAAATAMPRIHHQWLPDELRIETGLSPDTIRLLEGLGHRVVVKPAMGSTQSILIAPDGLWGASDPRRPDALAAGH